MKHNFYKIGTEWVNIDPLTILYKSDFTHSQRYEDCIKKGKSNIDRYVDENKTMLALISEGGRRNDYALRQIIYRNACSSLKLNRLQTEGRDYYRNEVIKRIKEAITSEYANLPEFFRNAYSIDDIVLSYYNKVTADCKNEINRAATDYFYKAMRMHINGII